MFSKDRYEILYCSNPFSSDEQVIQCIQGADVRVTDINLKHNIHWINDIIGGEIEKVSFLVENNSHKLGDMFFNSPYGIIKKNRTGIGATTLELNSDRNSIIVVPTRALAYDKAHSIREEVGYWKFLYVGSPMPGVPNDMPTIREYLLDATILNKKILVVADSLYKVIRDIGPSVFDSYFFMVDEIDSYQSDSTYRSTLEDVIDYYFKFNHTNRCLVSATINEFSNPEINNESVINIAYSQPAIRNINLIHTNNLHTIAVEKIQEIFYTTEDKILIAYNKITNIKQIIEALSPECKDNCAVLCSPSSKSKVIDYYNELINNSIPKRITFITCTYFVGIDINERYNLISISNIDNYYTVLSSEKLIQIAGRCRDSNGLISELIIYNTEFYENSQTPEQYKYKAIELADDIKTFINQADSIHEKYDNLIGSHFLDVKDEIMAIAKFRLSANNEVTLIRKNINGNFTLSYFNIDAIYEFYKLKNNLYSLPEQLLLELENQGNSINYNIQDREFTQEQIEINNRVIDEIRAIEEDELDELTVQIREMYETGNPSDNDLKRLTWDSFTSKKSKIFIDQFIELHKYIQLDQLIEKLKIISTSNKKAYRGFYNSAIFWALAENHPFKQSIYREFLPTVQYTRQEVIVKMTNILSYHINRNVNETTLIQLANQFCYFTRGNSHGTIFTVNLQDSYNPKEFVGEPISIIAENTQLREIIQFAT